MKFLGLYSIWLLSVLSSKYFLLILIFTKRTKKNFGIIASRYHALELFLAGTYPPYFCLLRFFCGCGRDNGNLQKGSVFLNYTENNPATVRGLFFYFFPKDNFWKIFIKPSKIFPPMFPSERMAVLANSTTKPPSPGMRKIKIPLVV